MHSFVLVPGRHLTPKLGEKEDFLKVSHQLARWKVAMLRLGSNLFQMRSVRNDDILLSRLKLMVVMVMKLGCKRLVFMIIMLQLCLF